MTDASACRSRHNRLYRRPRLGEEVHEGLTHALLVRVIVAGRLALRARKMPVDLTGAGAFVGRDITVQVRDGRAFAFVEGAWWSARPTEGTLSDGEVVRVKELDGLDLVVEQRGVAPSRKEPM